MRNILLLLIPGVFLCSCASMIQSKSVEKAYQYRTFFDKKLIIAPFSRDKMTFEAKRWQKWFDSLNALNNGRLDDSLSSVFAAGILGGLETINGIPSEWTDEQRQGFFQAIKDTANLVKVIHKKGKKETRLLVPDRATIQLLAPDANMVCYVQKIELKLRPDNTPFFAVDFVIYDNDSSTVIASGSIKSDFSDLGIKKQENLSETKADTWITLVSCLSQPFLKRSPFIVPASEDLRVCFNAIYATAGFDTIKFRVSVYSVKYNTSLIYCADKKHKA